MEYHDFVEKAVSYDKRNSFSKYSGNIDLIPDVLKPFYRDNNPSDVEINCVRFFPAEELSSIQAEYSYLNAQFIFATCNGDPIFLNNGYVYTTSHGVENPEWELLANDIESYFSALILNGTEFEDEIWNTSEKDLLL